MFNRLWNFARRSAQKYRRKPWLEVLEDRCTPSAMVAEFPLRAGVSPSGIAAGPDGKLWFVESNINSIAVIDPSTHAITEFKLPSAGSQPIGIVAERIQAVGVNDERRRRLVDQ